MDSYSSEIEELSIVEPFSADEDLVLETLQKSLDNGKSFYENAPEDIMEDMERYQRDLDSGVMF